MTTPTITQTWTISPNNRYTWVAASSTVKLAMGSVMFSLSSFLITTCGWTCKGSCDGTTGAMDGVNRITDATKWGTRNNGAAGAQSWIVVTDGAGVDWCFSYNSSSDDVVRLAHSTGGNYVAAGTPAQQPTATDECFDSTNIPSWVNSTTSLDRVWHIWASADKKMWRLAIIRNGAMQYVTRGEKFTSAIVSPTTFSLTTGGGTVGAIKSQYNSFGNDNMLGDGYFASTFGDLCRVHMNGGDTNSGNAIAGEVFKVFGNNLYMANEKPMLQGATGHMLFPANLSNKGGATTEGKLGNCIDQWYGWVTSGALPALNDIYGDRQLISLGQRFVWPWDGVSMPVVK